MIVAKIVDTQAAWQAVWTSVVAGIGVTLIFSFGVLGATRAADHRRAGNGAISALFGLLAMLAAAATIGACVYAITLITTK